MAFKSYQFLALLKFIFFISKRSLKFVFSILDVLQETPDETRHYFRQITEDKFNIYHY